MMPFAFFFSPFPKLSRKTPFQRSCKAKDAEVYEFASTAGIKVLSSVSDIADFQSGAYHPALLLYC